METKNQMTEWGMILGASSGFGEATALALAKRGMNIFGIHLDRRSTIENPKRIISQIQEMGREAIFFNCNAADATKRKEVLDTVERRFSEEARGSVVRVFLHSLAFGTLRPFIAENPEEAITQAQMEMTVDVMAHSLVYWVQDLVSRKLLKKGGRIFAMTSAGGQRVWPTYGAVSAAKAALESHIRQLALDLAPLGITANAIRAGVTDTPALRKIPHWEEMIKKATQKNPFHRLTTPAEVGAAIATLASSGTEWMTGNVIGVDGGEEIVG